jgi:hypothetical protein
MSRMNIKTILIVCFSFISLCAFADTFDDVALAIKNGNAKEIAKYFNTNIELTVLDNEGVYSKPQAEVILKNFFGQNPAVSVSIHHRGSSAQGSKYAIATYVCQKSKYRTYIFMKDSGAGMTIQELRFEKE